MKNKLRRGLSVLLPISLLAAALCAGVLIKTQEDAGVPSVGICYRVTGDGREAYLLGSIHVGSKAMYPFGQSIREALDHADALVFECDSASEAAARVSADRMRIQDGETLRQKVSEACYSLVERAATAVWRSTAALDAYQPWAATSMLSVRATANELGVKDASEAIELGVERQVRNATQSSAKPTLYLETVEEQLDTLQSLSPELQQYLLSTACQQVLGEGTPTAMEDGVANWPEWWSEGNAEAFAQTYLSAMAAEAEPALAREYHEALITSRNHAMARQIDEWMRDGGYHRLFITVGLLHLVLENDSVISELKNMGYTVERVV